MISPRVTVLMSVYNGEKYLREAIDSILNQTFKDFEFIVINDGSTDRTPKILKSYHDPRIKIINNQKNMGLTRSLNNGLKVAKGKYIARQDADDISAPERLKKEIDFLETHRDYAVVGTFMKIVNEHSDVIRTLERPIEDSQIREYLKKNNCIPHGSAMVRKRCLLDIGPYDESMPRSQDYDLWLRISEKYRLANIPEYLYVWRSHNKNITAKYGYQQKICVELAKAKALERRLGDLLLEVKANIVDVQQASMLIVNIIAAKNYALFYKRSKGVFHFIKFITCNRIDLYDVYKGLVKRRFVKRINRALNEFQMGRISLEKARVSLTNIANRKLK